MISINHICMSSNYIYIYIYIMRPSNVSRDIIILYRHTLKTHVPIKYMDHNIWSPSSSPTSTPSACRYVGEGLRYQDGKHPIQFGNQEWICYQIISNHLKEKTCLVGFQRGENHVASTPKLMTFLLPKCRDGLIAEAEDYPCVKHSLETSVCESPCYPSGSQCCLYT